MINSNSITSKCKNCNGINPINSFFRVEIWDLGLERRGIIWAWAMGIQLSSSWGNRPIVPLLLYIWLAGHSTSRGILYFKAPEVSLSKKKHRKYICLEGPIAARKKTHQESGTRPRIFGYSRPYRTHIAGIFYCIVDLAGAALPRRLSLSPKYSHSLTDKT